MKKNYLKLIITSALLTSTICNYGFAQAIAAGNHSLALCNDSTVRAWGYNLFGQLGDGSTGVNSSSPVPVVFLSNIIAIKSGERFSLALRSDGSVWSFGYNADGEVGDGTTIDRYSPVQVHDTGNVGFLSGITAISGGGDYGHSLALKNDGTVWAWGFNSYGGLGDNTNNTRTSPVQVHGEGNVGFLSNTNALAAGDGFSLALKNDSTIFAWGQDNFGQLGDSTNFIFGRGTPGPVSELTGITAIGAGTAHALAVKNDGTTWSWGYNGYGQLGDSTTNARWTPIKVIGLTGIIAVDGGQHHSLALKNDGTVWAWGYNSFGQLGDGTNIDRLTPIQVSSLTSIIAIAAGGGHSLALKNDGTLWTWGRNYFGQLGDGTTINRWSPIQVIGGLCQVTTPVNEIKESLSISIFPNPSNGKFSLKIEEGKGKMAEEGKMEIYNILGEKVLHSALQKPLNATIDLYSQSKGIYFVKIYYGAKIYNKKIIVQ